MTVIDKAALHSSPEEKEKEYLRVRSLYAQRAHQRKVELYFKALEIVRQKELCTSRQVTFRVSYPSQYGERVMIVGDHPALGSWVALAGRTMDWTQGGRWQIGLEVPRNVHALCYKYVVATDAGNVKWEWGNNHKLELDDETTPVVVDDEWGAGSSPA